MVRSSSTPSLQTRSIDSAKQKKPPKSSKRREDKREERRPDHSCLSSRVSQDAKVDDDFTASCDVTLDICCPSLGSREQGSSPVLMQPFCSDLIAAPRHVRLTTVFPFVLRASRGAEDEETRDSREVEFR